MGHGLDRVIYKISVIYIALPIFIFFAGWLKISVALPACAIFLISLYLMLKNGPEPISWHLSKNQAAVIIASLFLLALWVFLSGQGGFSFQNSDYQYRNAIFRDLITRPWPVVYDYTLQNSVSIASASGGSSMAMLTYYIAYWLPGALVGKIFGWYAGNAFLYFWALLGAALITYYLFRTLRNVKVWTVLILIFFSGMDILGFLLLSKGKFPGPIDHIEWWSGLQYSSNTTLMFWVFNQTITIWLAILLILTLKNSRSLFFLYSMLLLHGPFPFIGMLPIVLWKAYEGYSIKKTKGKTSPSRYFTAFFTWVWGGVRRALTFENTFGGISVLFIVYLYLSNNVSASRSGINDFNPNYFVFVIFECGFYLLFLFADHRKKPVYWICLISLLAIPFFRIGTSQDFCMRVSIPALFMIQIMVQQTLLGRPDKAGTAPAREQAETAPAEDKAIPDACACAPEVIEPDSGEGVGTGSAGAGTDEEASKAASGRKFKLWRADLSYGEKRFIRVALVIMLIIGAAVPAQEISRSAVYTLPAYPVTKSAMISAGKVLQKSGNPSISAFGSSMLTQSNCGMTWSDSVKTLGNNRSTSLNFIGPVKGNSFYEYLAKK